MDGIRSVMYDNRGANRIVRSIIPMKAKKPAERAFFNQTTVRIKPETDPNADEVNVKVFQNDSLQITGCKDMEDFYNVLGILQKILREGVDTTIRGTQTHVDFAVDPDNLQIGNVVIRLIVSCFSLGYQVDRRHLAYILKTKHSIRTTDDVIGYVKFKNGTNSKHSCVNIKYVHDEKTTVSVFVFYTGSVIITAAQSLPQIIAAYEYVVKIINHYKDEIRVYDYDKEVIDFMMDDYRKGRKRF